MIHLKNAQKSLPQRNVGVTSMIQGTRIGSLVLLFVLLLQPVKSFGVTARSTITKSGIIINTVDQKVELAVTNNSAFRISISKTGTPDVIASTFIDKSEFVSTKFTLVSKPPMYGIKTTYGKLIINTDTREWSLFDAKEKTLITKGTYHSMDSLQSFTHSISDKGRIYGTGNYSTKNLIKTKSEAKQGNGTSDLPYLWNTAGFSVLGITKDDNKPANWTAVGSSVNWTFKGTSADLYVWPAKTLYDAASGYVKLTGKPKLPPKWAFGYLQSQWGWADRAYIENVLSNFRTRKLPVDAFIIDFEWYTPMPDYAVKKEGLPDYSDFSFNPKLFPEPAKQLAEYKSQGVKFIGIRKPRLGNSSRLDLARNNGWLIEPKTNNRDLNYSNDSLRSWYGAQNKPLLDAGVDAWWNDEGESYYSCYYWWNKAEVDLRASARPNDRHFSINRSFSPGVQRMGFCTWNGDIRSTWKALLETPADLLNFSLSGMYYSTCDIGGFGDKGPEKEVLVRWFQAGVFLPVMRAHSNIFTPPHFPWLWGDDSEAAIRKALNLRYQLIPYIYSLGHEAYTTGAPIIRPLVMEFPNDTTVANMTDEWLMGKGLLAAPLLNAGGTRSVYLPDDLWFDFQTGQALKGPCKLTVTKALDEIPVYVRAGTILPLGPVIQYTGQDTIAPLEIRIYPGRDGSFTMSEDDGKSYDYTKSKVRRTNYIWSDVTKTLSWKVEGTYSDKRVFKTIRVVLGNEIKMAVLDKKGRLTF